MSEKTEKQRLADRVLSQWLIIGVLLGMALTLSSVSLYIASSSMTELEGMMEDRLAVQDIRLRKLETHKEAQEMNDDSGGL